MNAEHLSQFVDLLAGFDDAMLVTQHENGELRSRPMAIADCSDAARLWFITDVDSAKIDELTNHPLVNVTLQDGKTFLSISGTARAVRDRRKIRELWSVSQRPWFDHGKNDPALILLEIVPTYAEYWDRSGISGVRFMLAEARALLTGDTLSNDAGEHEKLPFPDGDRERRH